MFAPSELPPRIRNVAARLIHRAWEWTSAVGLVGPDDPHGRRFLAMGPRSGIAFPPGPRFGEPWIAIGSETLIGPHVSLCAGVPGEAFEPGRAVVSIGDRCNVGRGSSIAGRSRVTIEDDVITGPNVYITDHNHLYEDLDQPIGRQWLREAPVRVGAGSWLGAGVVVLPGADIGRHVTVGAGAVVRGVIPDCTVVAGVPARVVRRYDAAIGWTR
jgi:acetyltransferase-like isoleucine patch superfamily enzyme